MKLIFPHTVSGKENIPPEGDKQPLILCSNHISNLDPAYLIFGQKRHVYFMAKAELFQSKLGNWFFHTALGAFPVRRGQGDKGANATSVQFVRDGK